jgi:hypothetical protein
MKGAVEGDAVYDGDAVDDGCDAGCEAQTVEVEREAVAEIHARGRPAAKSPAECETGLDASAPRLAEAAGDVE